MTAKIKLNAASGGGSISIQAPSSSSNNRVISLPDIADGTLVTSQSTLDATKLSGALPAISGAALTGISATVKQIKSANFTSQFSFSNNSSFTASNITVDITPTSASSKILVFGSTNIYKSGQDAQVCTTIYRDSTNLGVSPLYGFGEYTTGSGSLNWVGIYNDSPNTTSQITYKIYTRVQSGHNGALGANNVPTNITAIEYSA